MLRAEQPVALVTVVAGPGVGNKMLITPDRPAVGSLGHPELDRIAARDALAELEAGRSGVRHYGPEGRDHARGPGRARPRSSAFIESWAPPPQMWIFGAVDFTAALGKVAKVLGYRVTVCDAREIFATRRRFPMADEVVVSWPGPLFERRGHTLGTRDAVCILTHDPKFDVPAVQGALATAAGYIGVMGSRKTHAKRMERLAEVGVDQPDQLARLMSPIGLDLGARTPEETAISICAEIIARRTGRMAAVVARQQRPHPRLTQPSGSSRVSRPGCRTRTELARRLEKNADLDVAPGVGRVHDGVVDAEPHHDVTRVVDQVAGLRRVAGDERRRYGSATCSDGRG